MILTKSLLHLCCLLWYIICKSSCNTCQNEEWNCLQTTNVNLGINAIIYLDGSAQDCIKPIVPELPKSYTHPFYVVRHCQVVDDSAITITEGGMPGYIEVTTTLPPKFMCENRTASDDPDDCRVVVWVEIETTAEDLQCYQVCIASFNQDLIKYAVIIFRR